MCKRKRTDSCSTLQLEIDGVDATTRVISTNQIGSGFAAPSKSSSELLPLETGEVITCRLKRDCLRGLDVVRYDLLGRLFDLVERL
jgi:hypothetical protein